MAKFELFLFFLFLCIFGPFLFLFANIVKDTLQRPEETLLNNKEEKIIYFPLEGSF